MADPIRKEIIDAAATAVGAVSTINRAKAMDFAQYDLTMLINDDQIPAAFLSPVDDRKVRTVNAYQDRTMELLVEVWDYNATLEETVADVIKAIYELARESILFQDLDLTSQNFELVDEDTNMGGMLLTFEVNYRIVRGDPYNN